jgi:hypothetical protein
VGTNSRLKAPKLPLPRCNQLVEFDRAGRGLRWPSSIKAHDRLFGERTSNPRGAPCHWLANDEPLMNAGRPLPANPRISLSSLRAATGSRGPSPNPKLTAALAQHSHKAASSCLVATLRISFSRLRAAMGEYRPRSNIILTAALAHCCHRRTSLRVAATLRMSFSNVWAATASS